MSRRGAVRCGRTAVYRSPARRWSMRTGSVAQPGGPSTITEGVTAPPKIESHTHTQSSAAVAVVLSSPLRTRNGRRFLHREAFPASHSPSETARLCLSPATTHPLPSPLFPTQPGIKKGELERDEAFRHGYSAGLREILGAAAPARARPSLLARIPGERRRQRQRY